MYNNVIKVSIYSVNLQWIIQNNQYQFIIYAEHYNEKYRHELKKTKDNINFTSIL